MPIVGAVRLGVRRVFPWLWHTLDILQADKCIEASAEEGLSSLTVGGTQEPNPRWQTWNSKRAYCRQRNLNDGFCIRMVENRVLALLWIFCSKLLEMAFRSVRVLFVESCALRNAFTWVGMSGFFICKGLIFLDADRHIEGVGLVDSDTPSA